jgi:hypothetical protein
MGELRNKMGKKITARKTKARPKSDKTISWHNLLQTWQNLSHTLNVDPNTDAHYNKKMIDGN